MIKIWAKLIENEKIIADNIFEYPRKMSMPVMEEMLREIAESMDLSTPLFLGLHFKHLREFHNVKFYARDFIDEFCHDYLELEWIL